MDQDSFDKRNFLFFLNYTKTLSFEDALIGALTVPSSWDAVAEMVRTARQKDAFVRSIDKAQLYIHVPFCGRICTFCDCSKVLLRKRAEIDAYIKALAHQMMLLAPLHKGMDADTILFGGGTPSILDEAQITAILDEVDKAFPAKRRKILFEANPSSWTASKLAALSTRGLYRLSVGVQSLDEKVLKLVCRSQTRKKVLWCLKSAQKAGVPYVNFDLMAGLPGQTVSSFIDDLKTLIDGGATSAHIYPYCGSSPRKLCSLGETVPEFFKRRDDMLNAAFKILTAAGFRRKGYDAFSLKGEGGRNAYLNLDTAIAAFGPSARGQFPGAVFYHVDENSTVDFTRVDACAQDFGYVKSHYAVLAIFYGLDERAFFRRFGVSLDQHCGEGLQFLRQSGLVALSKGVWKYSGKWEIRRLHEFTSLARILFGEEFLSRLQIRFRNQYDPRQDYSKGNSLLRTYADPWLMNLYYQLGF